MTEEKQQPVRGLAKAALGFSWAISMFGLQQMTKMMTALSGEQQERLAAEFEAVSRAAQEHLSEEMKQQFKTGDEWQRRIVDAMFGNVSADLVDPRKYVELVDPRSVMRATADLMQRSADAIKQATPGSASGDTGASAAA
jgi:hypothetical protein